MDLSYSNKISTLRLLLHITVNVALSYAISILFFPDDIVVMFLIFLSIIVFGPVILGLKGVLLESLLFYFRFQTMVDHTMADLRRGGIPSSGEYSHHDVESFLQEVGDDENLPVKARMKAVEVLATLQTVRSSNDFIFAVAFSAVLERAIRQLWAEGQGLCVSESLGKALPEKANR